MRQVGGKFVMDLSVFDGGLNTEVPEENLPLNQSPTLRMAVFDNYGALKSPSGYQTLNSTIFGPAGRVDGAISYKPATMSALLIGVRESVYVATGTATAFNLIASSQSLFTVNVDCDVVQFQEIAIFSNGGLQPYKFNGNEFTRAGVSAPSQTLTAVCDAAGSLTGTYRYVYWGVNSYSAQGDYVATASTAVVIASGNIRVNNIPTAPVSHGINTWKIGRNSAGATGVYWYVTDVANGTTSFTDVLADSSLVTLAPTDQGYLRKFKFMCVYANRLWGAAEDDSVLWFSNINQPEEFPSTNFIRVGRGDGLQISAIHPFKGTIVISKSDFNGKTALYQLIVGDSVTFADPENWNLVKLFDYGGSESHRACVDYSDYLTLVNRDGIYAFNGMSFSGVANPGQNGTFISSTISENVTSEFFVSGSEKFRRGAAAVNWKEKVWFGFDFETTGTFPRNAQLYIFDYARVSDSSRKGGAWSRMGSTYFANQQFVVHEGELLGATDGLGVAGPAFQRLDIGDMYDGSRAVSIDQFQYSTPRMRGLKEHESYFKDFRHIFITCSGQGTLTVRSSYDGFNSYEESTITLTSSLARYKRDLASTRGKDIQVRFLMTFASGDSVKITRLEVFYNLRGLRS